MKMEDRIAVLERDVIAIKTELAVLRAEHASAADLIARTTRIEIDLAVVKGEIARLRQDVSQLREDVSQLRNDFIELQKRVTRLEAEVAGLRQDVSLLREDFSQLREQVAQFQIDTLEGFAGIKVELARLATQQADFEAHNREYFASKADLKATESSTRAWMLGIALTIITLQFAMFYPLYGAMKTSPFAQAPQTQPAAVSSAQPPAAVPAAQQPAAGAR